VFFCAELRSYGMSEHPVLDRADTPTY